MNNSQVNLKGDDINYNISFFGKIIFVILLVIMLITSTFLYLEYNFFKKQSDSMLELQEDYRMYISAVNKILVDYNRIKEELENKQYESIRSGQKKKDKKLNKNNFSDIYFYDDFPQDAKIVSSQNDSSESFCVVNRDIKHLKSSSLNLIKNYYKSKGAAYKIKYNDFFDYTEYSLSKIAEANKMLERAKKARLRAEREKKFALLSKKIKKAKRSRYEARRKRVSSYPRENSSSVAVSRVSSRAYSGASDSDKGFNEINLSWPINKSNFYFSSLYGPRRKSSGAWGFHYGVDMAALKGIPVNAAYSGIVVEARYRAGYGNTIVIAHSRKYKTRYGHLSKILVSAGQKVSRSEVIGAVGNTGYVRSSRGDGSHLHFELIEFGKKINPLPFIS